MYFRRSVRQCEGILKVLPPHLRRQSSTGWAAKCCFRDNLHHVCQTTRETQMNNELISRCCCWCCRCRKRDVCWSVDEFVRSVKVQKNWLDPKNEWVAFFFCCMISAFCVEIVSDFWCGRVKSRPQVLGCGAQVQEVTHGLYCGSGFYRWGGGVSARSRTEVGASEDGSGGGSSLRSWAESVLEPVRGFRGNTRRHSITVAQPGGDGGTDESLRVTSKIYGGIFSGGRKHFWGIWRWLYFHRWNPKIYPIIYLHISPLWTPYY